MKARISIKNIKGQEREYELSDVTVLTGPNGAGKSAVLEAMSIAIEGEHPLYGKTLAGLSSVLSAPTGEVTLAIESDDKSLEIKRVYTVKDGSVSQKVYINQSECLQAEAKQKINEFFGGIGFRKLSPSRWFDLTPQEKVKEIAGLMGADKCMDVSRLIALTLAGGSEEFTGISRFIYKKSPDQLDQEEISQAIAEARKVDVEWFSMCDEFLNKRPSGEPIDFLESLASLARNKANAKQQDVVRATKSLETLQLELGPNTHAGKDAIKIRLDQVDAEILEHEKAKTERDYHLSVKRQMDEKLQRLIAENPGLDERIKNLRDKAVMVPLPTASRRELEARREQLASLLKSIKEADEETPRIDKEIVAINEEMASNQSSMDRRAKDLSKNADTLSRLKGVLSEKRATINLLKGDDSCPLCGSLIDGKGIIERLKQEVSTLSSEIKAREKDALALEATMQDLIGERRDKEKVLATLTDKKRVHGEVDRSKSCQELEAEIKILGEDIMAIEAAEAALLAKDQLDRLLIAKKAINDVEHDIKSLSPAKEPRSDAEALYAEKEKCIEELQQLAKYNTLEETIAREQLSLAKLSEERKMLKQIHVLIESAKESLYGFLAEIEKEVENMSGLTPIYSPQVFGLAKNKGTVSEKALSGGEKSLYAIASIAGILKHLPGVKVIELEGGELDSDNLKKAIEISRGIGIVLLATHNAVSPNDYPDANVICV